MYYSGDSQIFQKPRKSRKIFDAKRVTRRKPRIDDTQKLGDAIESLVACVILCNPEPRAPLYTSLKLVFLTIFYLKKEADAILKRCLTLCVSDDGKFHKHSNPFTGL
jgi:hypothetical protein